MKKVLPTLVFVAVCVGFVASNLGCGKTTTRPMVSAISGSVYSQDLAVSGVDVMICYEGGKEVMIKTDTKGKFSYACPTDIKVEGVIAVTKGQSGSIKVDQQLNALRIDIAPIIVPNQVFSTRVTGENWFGVYSTDGGGDVKFRYQYSFTRFTCINSLPWIWYGSWQNPDPNSWLNWSISDFSAPWKGKFLAVPTRLQWWHKNYYGYPIQKALYLISIG